MHRTRIKICGITRPQDAVVAARAGADAVGIVLYPKAKRYVPPERAREILKTLPPFITAVGLFVNAPADEVESVATQLNLRHIQLHGSESAEVVAQLQRFAVIKAIRVDRATIRDELTQWKHANLPHLRGFVLETASTGIGGTGVENDWELIAELKREGAFGGLPNIIAAGGLHPENVADIVRKVRPFAVDVSSGVEVAGVKSAEKIEQFVHEVERADPII